MPSLAVGLLLSTFLLLTSARDCFYLNGSLNKGISPCNSSIGGRESSESHSACCNADYYDACLSSGLCISTGYWYGRFPGEVWADGCTDPTGKDRTCPQVSSICGTFMNTQYMPLPSSLNGLSNTHQAPMKANTANTGSSHVATPQFAAAASVIQCGRVMLPPAAKTEPCPI